jgi:hypothetical protein
MTNKIYRFVKGLGYIPIENNELEKHVPELRKKR